MSKPRSFEVFIEQVADLLMVEQEHLVGGNIQDLPEFDSMARINVGLYIEEEYGYQVSLDDLKSVNSLRALFDIVLKNSDG